MFPDDTPNEPERLCRRCGTVKPLAEFSLCRSAKDGKQARCKTCDAAIQKARRLADPNRVKSYNKAYYAANRDKELVRVHARRAADPEKTRESTRRSVRKWRQNNLDYAREYNRNYQRRQRRALGMKERVKKPPKPPAKTRTPLTREENLRRIRERYATDTQYRESLKAKARDWGRQHLDQATARRLRRRARIANAPAIETISRIEIAERDGWRCHICGKTIPKSAKHPNPLSLSLDHLIPLARGGAHTRENVAAAHHRCNCSRGAGRIPAQLRLI